MEGCIRDWLAAGLIRPSSPVGTGFFFVAKKDKTLFPWINSRGLNDITIKNKYSLPRIVSASVPLQGATIFSKLDLYNAWFTSARGMVEDGLLHTPGPLSLGHLVSLMPPPSFSLMTSTGYVEPVSLYTLMTFRFSHSLSLNTDCMSNSFFRISSICPSRQKGASTTWLLRPSWVTASAMGGYRWNQGR